MVTTEMGYDNSSFLQCSSINAYMYRSLCLNFDGNEEYLRK